MYKVILILVLAASMLLIAGCGVGSNNGYASPREAVTTGELRGDGDTEGVSDEVGDKVGNYTIGNTKNKPVSNEEMFPVNVSVARVSYSNYNGYYNNYNSSQSKQNFNVITTRDIEQQEHYDKLAKLYGVDSIAPINFMMVPESCENVIDLCKASDVLNTDMLLVYTLETSNKTKAVDIGPLAAVTLGFTPNRIEYVTTTAAATLIDVRTGHVFGTFEGSWTNKHNASIWSKDEIRTNLGIDTQQKSFDILVNTVCKAWPEIVGKNRYRVVSSERSYSSLTSPKVREVRPAQDIQHYVIEEKESNSFWQDE